MFNLHQQYSGFFGVLFGFVSVLQLNCSFYDLLISSFTVYDLYVFSRKAAGMSTLQPTYWFITWSKLDVA